MTTWLGAIENMGTLSAEWYHWQSWAFLLFLWKTEKCWLIQDCCLPPLRWIIAEQADGNHSISIGCLLSACWEREVRYAWSAAIIFGLLPSLCKVFFSFLSPLVWELNRRILWVWLWRFWSRYSWFLSCLSTPNSKWYCLLDWENWQWWDIDFISTASAEILARGRNDLAATNRNKMHTMGSINGTTLLGSHWEKYPVW